MKGVLLLSFEMLMTELPDLAQIANFRGGLGILGGDIKNGWCLDKKLTAIVPLYSNCWVNGHGVFYDTIAPKILTLDVLGNTVNVRNITNRNNVFLLGLECPSVFDYLYTDNRWRRLQQEILFGKTVPIVLKTLNIKPDIIWLNESHTAVVLPEIKKDPFSNGSKILFTIHTPELAGNERYDKEWFPELKVSDEFHNYFVQNGCMDFTLAAISMADRINGVCKEHSQTTQETYPKYTEKVCGIRNGSHQDTWQNPRLREAGDNIDRFKLWQIHQEIKKDSLDKLGLNFNLKNPIFGFARRLVSYKNQYDMIAPIIRAICAERGESVDTVFGKLEGLGMQFLCAGYVADSNCWAWINEFNKWMQDPLLNKNFVFLQRYDFELLKLFGWGLDLGLHCPIKKREACGTSTQRWTINGIPTITSKTGGDVEFISEFNPETHEGNGFFIDPYSSYTVYQKAKAYSQIYYETIEEKNDTLLYLMENTFESRKKIDITGTLKLYDNIFNSFVAVN
ncbi:MAG: glycogen/starch synthase [Candidatus Pacebacteria bacterium]|nr:glycogen/starch synthase [Candidatus Paceibacterota bacterium]